MALRYIDNVTILADVGEQVTLPSVLIAREDNGNLTPVNVTWTPDYVDTSEEYELIFEGYVVGYAHTVLCSVQIGKMEDNPKSVFPYGDGDSEETSTCGGICIDEFGLAKKDIQTADIPDIDDYQYFKAKMPRTMVEELQLKQLRELLADKIILARDINHMRNAIVNIEKFLRDLNDRLKDLEERVAILEELIKDMVTDGENLGSGAEVFYGKSGSLLQFRTITGRDGVDVTEDGDEITISVDIPEGEQGGCGTESQADRFTTCGGDFPIDIESGQIKFSQYFGMKMVDVKNRKLVGGDPFPSMMWVMGVGESVEEMIYAGRMLKASRSFIIEMKTGSNNYAGVVIDRNGADFFNGDSLINEELAHGFDAYSSDIAL